MNYLGLTFLIIFVTCVAVALIQCYQGDKQRTIEYNSKLPENRPVELRAYRDTCGITDEEFIKKIPYHLEYKEPNDTWWKPIRMFQDGNKYERIIIKDKKDLEQWKSRFKTIKDIGAFNDKQEAVMKLWEQREIDKNCIY